jgi:hypothetical protein
MRTFVHHDADGAIHGVVTVDAPSGVTATLDPGPGLFVTEVAGLKLTGGPEDVETVRALAESLLPAEDAGEQDG